MSLSRKHYCAVAAILKDSATTEFAAVFPVSAEEMRGTIISNMADYFASDNPNFDRARFLTACKVTA